MADTQPKPATDDPDPHAAAGIPESGVAEGSGLAGSGSSPHPIDAIPLPAHGFASLDAIPDGAGGVPATEVITRAAVLLMSASADRLGMSPDGEPSLDLDEARSLITSLAGLLAASEPHLGERHDALRDGLRSLQGAFRAASRYPDAPGSGPGEQYLA